MIINVTFKNIYIYINLKSCHVKKQGKKGSENLLLFVCFRRISWKGPTSPSNCKVRLIIKKKEKKNQSVS